GDGVRGVDPSGHHLATPRVFATARLPAGCPVRRLPVGERPVPHAHEHVRRRANWSEAQGVGGNGRTRFPLSAAAFGGRLFLFAVGTDQGTYFNLRQNG